MDKLNQELYDRFEATLEQGLVKLCSSSGLLEGTLKLSDDIAARWDDFVRDYIADAVSNFNSYPDAAIAWAGFLGMAVAYQWDKDWLKHRRDSYQSYYGPRGFDDMDEHILRGILGFGPDSPQAKKISETMLSCSQATLGLISHEGIQTQTSDGFFILSRAYSVMFRIGASVELHRLGYKLKCVGCQEA